MTAIRQVQGCRASVMSSAVLWCTVICLVQFVYGDASVHYKDLRGSKRIFFFKAPSSNWTWTSLFVRLTCNTRPLHFSINVYPVLPGCVCPHNPIIPDKIFHYLEYFWPVRLWVTLRSLQPQSVPFSTGDGSFYLEGEILHQGWFSLLVKTGGRFVKLWPVVVGKVWLQWLLWAISLYCPDIKQSQGRVKPRNVAGE